MSRWRCHACGGTYDDPQPDGWRYFHACPPVRDPITSTERPNPGHRDESPDTTDPEWVRSGVVQYVVYRPRCPGAGREPLG
jgi:hypothetical protein